MSFLGNTFKKRTEYTGDKNENLDGNLLELIEDYKKGTVANQHIYVPNIKCSECGSLKISGVSNVEKCNKKNECRYLSNYELFLEYIDPLGDYKMTTIEAFNKIGIKRGCCRTNLVKPTIVNLSKQYYNKYSIAGLSGMKDVVIKDDNDDAVLIKQFYKRIKDNPIYKDCVNKAYESYNPEVNSLNDFIILIKKEFNKKIKDGEFNEEDDIKEFLEKLDEVNEKKIENQKKEIFISNFDIKSTLKNIEENVYIDDYYNGKIKLYKKYADIFKNEFNNDYSRIDEFTKTYIMPFKLIDMKKELYLEEVIEINEVNITLKYLKEDFYMENIDCSNLFKQPYKDVFFKNYQCKDFISFVRNYKVKIDLEDLSEDYNPIKKDKMQEFKDSKYFKIPLTRIKDMYISKDDTKELKNLFKKEYYHMLPIKKTQSDNWGGNIIYNIDFSKNGVVEVPLLLLNQDTFINNPSFIINLLKEPYRTEFVNSKYYNKENVPKSVSLFINNFKVKADYYNIKDDKVIKNLIKVTNDNREFYIEGIYKFTEKYEKIFQKSKYNYNEDKFIQKYVTKLENEKQFKLNIIVWKILGETLKNELNILSLNEEGLLPGRMDPKTGAVIPSYNVRKGIKNINVEKENEPHYVSVVKPVYILTPGSRNAKTYYEKSGFPVPNKNKK